MITQHAQQQKHTPGKLQVHDGALDCEEMNTYGNWIVASCDRERTPEDTANLNRLAHCWNCHDQLVEALRDLVGVICSMPGYPERNVTIEDCDVAKAALLAATGKDTL